MTVITVSKGELENRKDIEEEARIMCENIKYSVTSVCFYPKPGYLIPLVVFFGERRISYKIDFDVKD